MGEIKIREARIRDTPRILEMVKLSFPEEIGLFGLNMGQIRDLLAIYGLLWALQRLRHRPFFQFFVAESAGKAVAGAMMDLYEDYAYVSTVMVHPEHRRRGVGKTLLSQALAEVFRLGAKRTVLHVRGEVSDPSPESAQEPAARAVYGPSQVPRGLRFLFTLGEKVFLLLERGSPVGVGTVRNTGKTAVISVGLVPWADKKELAWALLIQALRKGQRTVLRTTAKSTSVIEVAKSLRFRQAYQELGLVLEGRS